MNIKDWITKRMGRYSKGKEALVVCYLEVYRKWRRRRCEAFAYAPVKELKKACHHYFKYKDIFVLSDSDSYKMGESCKWILKWTPEFEDFARTQFLTSTPPDNYTTSRETEHNIKRLTRLLPQLGMNGKDWASMVIQNDGVSTDYYSPRPYRLYTNSMSIQYVSRVDRKLLIPHWHDYDFKNCHWSIFIQTFNIDKEYRDFLELMLLDSDAFMQKVCEESGNDYGIMKSRRNSILYGSKSGTGSKTLNTLRDYHQRYLAESGKDASKLFYALSRYEALMLDICRELDPNWKLLMYDGWMTETHIDIAMFEEAIYERLKIKIIITNK